MPRKYNQFDISERKVLLRIFDVVWVLFSLYVVGILFSFDYFDISSQFWTWGLVLAIYLSVFANVFELYDLQKAGHFPTVLKNAVLTTSVTVLFFLLTPYFTPTLPENRVQIFYFYLTILSVLLLWRYAYIAMVSSPRFYKRVLMMGNPTELENIAKQIQQADPNYSILGFLCIDGVGIEKGEKFAHFPVSNISATIRENSIDELLISGANSEGNKFHINEQLIELLKNGFPVKDYNQVYEEKTQRIPVQHLKNNFYEFFPFSRLNENKFYLFFHRLADILISVVGLVIGFLLIPFILIGNSIANRGTLFYRQERLGRNGKIFEIVKFRSMRTGSEPDGAQWAQKNDQRVTKFGKFMRRARLDEFPQFYNILKGEMSLIGPRPERPVFVKQLSEMIPFYDTRHVIKPGLTGWAQVMTEYGDSHADSLEKLQYDLYYIKHRNLFLDITILSRTLSTIIFFRGQ